MGGKRQGIKVRAAAARAVDAVVSSGRSLDDALAKEEAGVHADDISLLRLLAYGTLRHHWRLQSWIDALLDRPLRKRDQVVNALLAVGLYQLTETRIPDHAAVSQTVEAARTLGRQPQAGLVNACMRRFRREELAAREPASDEARYDHPGWLIDAIRKDWPDDAESILAANNERAPMWLRVNAARDSTSGYIERLAEQGIVAASQPGLDNALRLAAPRPVDELPGFADGDVSVQDGAAQIAASWVLDGVCGRVLDACAAPGGKSAHLLELGGDTIELTCLDVDKRRLAILADNLDRLGLDATVLAGDASNPKEWWDKRRFNAILLDAPCSASGVIRRHPDIKLLRRASDIDRLASLQLSILKALWPLLEPGGRLLYVTCSVLAAENEGVIARFLESSPDARANCVLPNNNISDVMRHKTRGHQVLPGTAGLDGFYYACLEKVS
jgi:16S rRNA (cytosine967-C5)-methyltransferase